MHQVDLKSELNASPSQDINNNFIIDNKIQFWMITLEFLFPFQHASKTSRLSLSLFWMWNDELNEIHDKSI